jgi:beta-galactosidase
VTPGGSLELVKIRDRADIHVAKQRIAIQMRGDEAPVKIPEGKLRILVENMGRINYAFDMYDEKGLVRGATLNGKPIENWKMYPIPLSDVSKIRFREVLPVGTPAFYKCIFRVDSVGDTFLNPVGFDKGVAIVNGFNLGRYWSIGPQQTLYVPAGVLKPGDNELVLFEVGEIKSVKDVVFQDVPQIDHLKQ